MLLQVKDTDDTLKTLNENIGEGVAMMDLLDDQLGTLGEMRARLQRQRGQYKRRLTELRTLSARRARADRARESVSSRPPTPAPIRICRLHGSNTEVHIPARFRRERSRSPVRVSSPPVRLVDLYQPASPHYDPTEPSYEPAEPSPGPLDVNEVIVISDDDEKEDS